MARDALANLRSRGLNLRHRALELRLHRLLERVACGGNGRERAECRSTTASTTTTNAYPNRGGTPRLTPSSLCSKSSSESKSACDSAERDASLGGFWSILTSMGGSGPRLPICAVARSSALGVPTRRQLARDVIYGTEELATGGQDTVQYQYHTRITDNYKCTYVEC